MFDESTAPMCSCYLSGGRDLRMDCEVHRLDEPTQAEKYEFAEAHAEGLHDEDPREFCPECEDKRNRK